MNRWTAIIPFKPAGMRKTRLAGRLDERERDALSCAMFAHVTAALADAPCVADMIVLAREPPPGWRHAWAADVGRGLNAELEAARRYVNARRLIVIHADLPFLRPDDIAALAAPHHAGCAVAPDRFGAGTNALALRDMPDFRFCFGAGSRARHVAAAGAAAGTAKGAGARIVDLPGLSFDLDTADDYEAALRRGWPASALVA